MSVERFFEYARKRYQLKLDKEADFERPWTKDPILQAYRFCNVFREDDTVTKWIRSHIHTIGFGDKVLGAIVIARWFNRIPTLEKLLCPPGAEPPYFQKNLLYSWSHNMEQWKADMRERLAGVKPLVTGAYMIKTPTGMNKLEGILWCLERFLPNAEYHNQLFAQEGYQLEHANKVLQEFPFMGAFMSYEVVTDLRHSIMGNAKDIMTWANPGPGAARGLSRVQGLPVDHYKRHASGHQQPLQEGMQQLLKLSQKPEYWPSRWPQWEMREVEHTLCEFDKYERARLGEGKPKQKYKPAEKE